PPSSPHSRCPSGSAPRWTTSLPRRGTRAARRSRGSLSSVTVDLGAFDALTFDCYGTLIDWEAGLLAALREALPAADGVGDDALLESYAGHEAEAERPPYRSYRAGGGGAALLPAVPLLRGGARDGPPRRHGRPRPRGGRRRGRALLGERPRLAGLPRQRRRARPSARAIPAPGDHELRHRSLRGVEREARRDLRLGRDRGARAELQARTRRLRARARDDRRPARADPPRRPEPLPRPRPREAARSDLRVDRQAPRRTGRGRDSAGGGSAGRELPEHAGVRGRGQRAAALSSGSTGTSGTDSSTEGAAFPSVVRSGTSLRNHASTAGTIAITMPQRKTPWSAFAKICRKSARTSGGSCLARAGSTAPASRSFAVTSAGRRFSSLASREAKMAPKSATPNEPPTERKKVAVEVTTPMSCGRASFWTISTSTCMTSPRPMPTIAM